MSPMKERLLKQLLACNGMELNTPERRVAASLIRDGLVAYIEACGIRVYKATDRARRQHKELFA